MLRLLLTTAIPLVLLISTGVVRADDGEKREQAERRARAEAQQREAHERADQARRHAPEMRKRAEAERREAKEREGHRARDREQAERHEDEMRARRRHRGEDEEEVERRHDLERELHELLGEHPEERLEQIRRFLGEFHGPEALEEFAQARRHPERLIDVLHEILPEFREMARLRTENPHLYELHGRGGKLEREAEQIVEHFHRVRNPQEREETKHRLLPLLNELFDVKEQIRRAEMEQLERELERLREILHAREQNRERIIERHVGELLADRDEVLDF